MGCEHFTDLQNQHLTCFCGFRGSLTEPLCWMAEVIHQTRSHPETLASATVRGLLGRTCRGQRTLSHTEYLPRPRSYARYRWPEAQEDEPGSLATSHETKHSPSHRKGSERVSSQSAVGQAHSWHQLQPRLTHTGHMNL